MSKTTEASPCPYGPEYQVYWDLRYSILSKFDQCQVDATGLYTMVFEEHASGLAKMATGKTVLDICSGVGAMSIAFARAGLDVISIEIDKRRAEMARHNAEVYGVSGRIDIRNCDITDNKTHSALPQTIDTVFMDPPWGNGPGDYMRREMTFLDDLKLAGMDLREIIKPIPCKQVLMRFPPNFDFETFRHIEGDKLAIVTKSGYLHFYVLSTSKEEFLKVPDRSA